MENLEEEFEKRKPWVTQFTINGKRYGGRLSFDNDIRIKYFFDMFPNAYSILELGSLEGGHTFQLSKKPGVTVLGIEGRQENIAKANFVKELLHIENARFTCANLEDTLLSDFGTFDAVFCSGLLYHLPKPWDLVWEISKVTEKVFIWTHYATEEKVTDQINGYKGHWHKEFDVKLFGLRKPLKGLSKKSFWMTQRSLEDVLTTHGFKNIKILENKPHHKHGAALTIAAWKS